MAEASGDTPPKDGTRQPFRRAALAGLAIGAAAGGIAAFLILRFDALTGLLGAGVAGLIAVLLARRIVPRGLPSPAAARAGPPQAAAAGDPAAAQDAAIDLVRHLPAPAILVDRQREVRAVSRSAEGLLRRAAEGRPLPDLVRHPELLSAVQQSIAEGSEAAVTIRESVPAERHIEALIAPLGGGEEAPDAPEAGPWGALILLRDLTGEVRADRARADLVANVSHELRTPLASLAGFIETLGGPAANDSAARERFLPIMAEQTARMTRLVDTLMSLSNIEMAAHRPPTGRVELNATVGRVVDALRIVARRTGGRIAIDSALDPAEIAGDEDQVAQVARNLIENAIKYGRPGTAIEVRVFGTVPQAAPEAVPVVALSVSDRGDGIPEEHLPRLTERFYRVDDARTRPAAEAGAGAPPDSGGAGLGLAIVKHIVARHGGRLEIASELGVGSTFTIVFPPAPPQAGD